MEERNYHPEELFCRRNFPFRKEAIPFGQDLRTIFTVKFVVCNVEKNTWSMPRLAAYVT